MKLPKNYDPSQYESDIYELWEKSEVFRPSGEGKPYSLVVPPPNANGDIHIGTALTIGIEDILVRYHRLKGDRALLLPGADHAGFETQVVYERQLAKKEKSRFDFSREELYSQIWDFVAQNRKKFELQFRRLGAGVDWSRYTFTLDDKIISRAYKTFKQMWDEGLIYRGERLVNFCTFHGTAFADIEVEYKEERGHLWYIRYPLTAGDEAITVATTRPETMLGDTAVAVSPNDKRYQKFIGKTVRLPLTNREIPVIADEFVDKNFGTGAVKITPAHDPNDFEAGKRHDLPMISVIDHEGKIENVPEQYRGLNVNEARKKVVDDLSAQNFLVKTENYTHNVGHCYKCGTIIQPLLREQWFVDMQPLARPAIEVLKAKKIKFYPDSKRLQLIHYLENLKDWNISRQIAWGIPIPAFQNVEETDDWIYDERVDKEIIEVAGKTYHRDPDVFDTWFSSSSWPYATLDYPDSQDFRDFYPLSVMETGGEILYPWVSRMIMLGLYVTGEVPFKDVYIHGYVMAEDGAKMSKSLGNVINPVEVMDKYGSDALRMGVLAGRVPAVNRGYDPRRVEEARNFCNKLWNIVRYIEGKLGDDFAEKPSPKSLADHWVLNKLQHITELVGRYIENYRFAEAYEALYHFVWDDFADWYIEASKSQLNASVLSYTLESILKVLHPFAPFITETIWQTLHSDDDSILAADLWPRISGADENKGKEFEEIVSLVSEIRNLTNTLKIKDVTLYYGRASSKIVKNKELITRLARLKDIREVDSSSQKNLTSLTNFSQSAWLDVEKSSLQKYVRGLETKRQDLEESIKKLTTRLDNKSYVENAPKELVEQTKQQLLDTDEQLKAIEKEIIRFR